MEAAWGIGYVQREGINSMSLVNKLFLLVESILSTGLRSKPLIHIQKKC